MTISRPRATLFVLSPCHVSSNSFRLRAQPFSCFLIGRKLDRKSADRIFCAPVFPGHTTRSRISRTSLFLSLSILALDHFAANPPALLGYFYRNISHDEKQV